MEIASTLINVFVVVAVGAFLTYMTRERHREVREDLARLEARMDTGFAAVRSEFNAGLAGVRSEFNAQFGSVRSDITSIALALGAEGPKPSEQRGNA